MTLNYKVNGTVSEFSMIGYARDTYFKDMSKPDGDACHEDRTGQTHHQSPIFKTTWTPSPYYHICQMRKKGSTVSQMKKTLT